MGMLKQHDYLLFNKAAAYSQSMQQWLTHQARSSGNRAA
ncbi:hypothetical protein ACZ87_03298 [Candidatus Erwinia dacicola]|uniref:Uncharacterized protein n=1 Tax=Candidatus Erwinia dacicola TaxID=252393 RepID=A0A328TQ18_9GAMM|nr:hypothetical protein ACZ87_03298 [Candidatus Erwinia dacicola]